VNIRLLQQDIFKNYLTKLHFESPYTFPEGNQIRPLPPLHTSQNGLMIIGAYPSAKFECIKGKSGRYRLIPVANNLHPFAIEHYYDGLQKRELRSGEALLKYYLAPFGLTIEKCWVTDLVKVFLYKAEHREAIHDAFEDFNVPVLRDQFKQIGGMEENLRWIHEEIKLCNPKCIISLGEEVSQVLLNTDKHADKLLTPDVKSLNGYPLVCCPHPEACSRSAKWERVAGELEPVIDVLLKL
jgi:hypothetical protein